MQIGKVFTTLPFFSNVDRHRQEITA